jgi:hypothetical protein
MTLRLLFFVLVFVNLVFFAWTKSNSATSDEGREPQRLEQQLEPEKLRILIDGQEPALKPVVELACRLVSGLSMAEAEALKASLTVEAGEVRILPLVEPALHVVVIAELANKAAADKKIAELGTLGVTGQSSVEMADGRHEIVLGSFPTEVGALEFLHELVKQGVKSARAEAREQPARKAQAEARGPAQTLLPQLPTLIAPYAGASIGACAP